MKINSNEHVMFDLFHYDIEKCAFSVLKKMNININNISEDDRKERLIKIGLMMKENENLKKIVRNTITNIINNFIKENNLTEDDIILKEFDGVISRKLTTEIGEITPVLRKIYKVFITDIDKKMYIAIDEKRIIYAKGIPNLYDEMNQIYKMILDINFMSKKQIFSELEKIKNYFFTTSNKDLFLIPGKGSSKFYIFLKGFGKIEIEKDVKKYISNEELDRKEYFSRYISPFTKSLLIEFL